MKQPAIKHESAHTEPSERLRQAVRLLYEYVLQRKHTKAQKEQGDNPNAYDKGAENLQKRA